MSGEELPSVIEIDQQRRAANVVGPLSVYAAVSLEQLEVMASHDTAQLLFDLVNENPGLEARVEQAEALDAIHEARINGAKRALVQMATGLGKTTVVAADVKRFLEEKPDARVLFLCHQNDILAQARERFERLIGGNHTFGNFTGEEQDFHEVTCLFASFQVMHRWREAFMKDEFDYVVVDESQHGKAPTYEPTLEYFEPEFMLGVTATPDRHDLKDIREIFGEEIYRLSLEEAIARGLLAEVGYHVITDEIVDTNTLRDLRGKKLSIKQLDRTIFAPKRDEEIVRIINEKSEDIDKPKRIVFCKSIEQAEEYAQYFDNAAPLHSKLPKWEQDNYIQQFRDSEIDTLLTIDMFNEGIDIPDANQVIFLRSTQSKTIFLQQLGRGLRRAPGKESVQVLDFVANCERLAMIDEVWQDIGEYNAAQNSEVVDEVMRVEIGEVHFTEVAREVLDILDEIESNNALYRNWGPEDSKAYYRRLCDTLGRVAGWMDIEEARLENIGPSYGVLTKKHFNHRLSELQRACGIVKEKPENNWTAEDSVGIYREMSQGRQIGRAALQVRLMGNKELPSVAKVLEPFEGDMRALQTAAGFEPSVRKRPNSLEDWTDKDSVSTYKLVGEGEILNAREFDRRLREHPDLPSMKSILVPFDGKLSELQGVAGINPEFAQKRKSPTGREKKTTGADWSDWTAEDSARVFRDLSGDQPMTSNELERILREEHPELPSIRTILKPFSGRMPGLIDAAGYERSRKSTRTKDDIWTAEDSIRIYKQLSGDSPLPPLQLTETLAADKDLPSSSTLLKPFDGKFSELKKAAGYAKKQRKQ